MVVSNLQNHNDHSAEKTKFDLLVKFMNILLSQSQ